MTIYNLIIFRLSYGVLSNLICFAFFGNMSSKQGY